jgi:hypothetical protein
MQLRRSSLSLSLSLLALLAVLLVSGFAQAQIKSPGAHNKYAVELEPHFVLQWENRPIHDDGIGLGLRATIPFLDNGPISSINNNMGIGFGLDWVHYSSHGCGWWWYGRYRFGGPGWWDNCSANSFHLPVVLQWNFFLTPIISVFGEAGFGVHHWSVSFDNCATGPGYDCDYSDTELEFLFWGGGRFSFGEKSPISAIVRIGYPYISAGIGIML